MDKELKAIFESLNIPSMRLFYAVEKGEEPPDVYITFQCITRQDGLYADDDSAEIIHHYRVNLYTKGDYRKILKDLKAALKTGGFTISEDNGDSWENDVKRYHVPLTILILEE